MRKELIWGEAEPDRIVSNITPKELSMRLGTTTTARL
jgi:hypothetical protein